MIDSYRSWKLSDQHAPAPVQDGARLRAWATLALLIALCTALALSGCETFDKSPYAPEARALADLHDEEHAWLVSILQDVELRNDPVVIQSVIDASSSRGRAMHMLADSMSDDLSNSNE